jgi:hypothetical protein
MPGQPGGITLLPSRLAVPLVDNLQKNHYLCYSFIASGLRTSGVQGATYVCDVRVRNGGPERTLSLYKRVFGAPCDPEREVLFVELDATTLGIVNVYRYATRAEKRGK